VSQSCRFGSDSFDKQISVTKRNGKVLFSFDVGYGEIGGRIGARESLEHFLREVALDAVSPKDAEVNREACQFAAFLFRELQVGLPALFQVSTHIAIKDHRCFFAADEPTCSDRVPRRHCSIRKDEGATTGIDVDGSRYQTDSTGIADERSRVNEATVFEFIEDNPPQ